MNKLLEKGGYSVNGHKTPRFFEEWAKRNLMRPVCIVRDPDGDILLADSNEPIRKSDIWPFNKPFYRTGYAIHRDGCEVGNYHDYPVADYAFMSRQRGIEHRVNEALAHARQTQAQLKDAGYYDAERKGRFSLRPN